jgi:negative regulator of genetic competence, sporulation and motility
MSIFFYSSSSSYSSAPPLTPTSTPPSPQNLNLFVFKGQIIILKEGDVNDKSKQKQTKKQSINKAESEQKQSKNNAETKQKQSKRSQAKSCRVMQSYAESQISPG